RVAKRGQKHPIRPILTEKRKGAAPRDRAFSKSLAAESALRELEAATGFRAAVFLPFDHARVTGQEARGLERRTQAGLVQLKRLADTVLHGTGLTRQAAALDGRLHVILAGHTGHVEGLAQNHLQHRTGEIVVDVLAVHDNLAGTRLDPDAGSRVLPLAGRIGAAQVVAP